MGQGTRMINGVIYDEKTISFEKYIQMQCYAVASIYASEELNFSAEKSARHAQYAVDEVLKLNNCKVIGVEDATKNI